MHRGERGRTTWGWDYDGCRTATMGGRKHCNSCSTCWWHHHEHLAWSKERCRGKQFHLLRDRQRTLPRMEDDCLPSDETSTQSDHSRCHCLLLYYRIRCADPRNRRISHSANCDHHSWTVQLPHVDTTADSASGTRSMPVSPSSTRLLSPGRFDNHWRMVRGLLGWGNRLPSVCGPLKCASIAFLSP
jgi:hypothetical protein